MINFQDKFRSQFETPIKFETPEYPSYISTNSTKRLQNYHFLNLPSHSFCWSNIGMVLYLLSFPFLVETAAKLRPSLALKVSQHSICILGQSALSACFLLCWIGWNWFMGRLGKASCKVHLIYAQTSQEGIKSTKAKE